MRKGFGSKGEGMVFLVVSFLSSCHLLGSSYRSLPMANRTRAGGSPRKKETTGLGSLQPLTPVRLPPVRLPGYRI